VDGMVLVMVSKDSCKFELFCNKCNSSSVVNELSMGVLDKLFNIVFNNCL